MFSPPKLTTIMLNSLAILLLFVGSTDAQQAEFNRRAEAMQEARARAQQPAQVRRASSDNDIGIDYSAPPTPQAMARIARSQQQTIRRQPTTASQNRGVSRGQNQAAPQRIAQGNSNTRQVASRYVPEHMRTAQLMQSAIVDDGAPIVDTGIMSAMPYDGGYIEGEIIDGGSASCDTCGDAGGYFDDCDSCCDRGGCPPGNCWINGFGKILRNAEYFGGATSFRSALFTTPGATSGFDDSSHGFYGGFNLGMPLCRLSCGLFSTQIGVRSVQTNFNGNEFTAADRNQTFVTLGFYRRVDYGIQGGIAIDYLNEEWFSTIDLAQIRGELGWVYPNGTNLGFRYATNVSDETSTGVVNNVPFVSMLQSTQENYRFYCKREIQMGGSGEAFVGWSDNNQTVFGMDFDVPLRDRLALQSGFTYFLGDENAARPANQIGGNADDTYNIYVGLVFRPRGLVHNRSYDRPLFSVADNGSMLITRN